MWSLGLKWENRTKAAEPHMTPSARPPSESSANCAPLYTRLTATSTTAAARIGRHQRGATAITGTSSAAANAAWADG